MGSSAETGEDGEFVDHDGIEPIVRGVLPVSWNRYRNYGISVARANTVL